MARRSDAPTDSPAARGPERSTNTDVGTPRVRVLTRGLKVSLGVLTIGLPCLLREPSRGMAVTTVLRSDSVMVWEMSFSPDGRAICTTGRDKSATSWDVAARRGRTVALGPPGGCAWAIFIPGGTALATVNGDSTVTLWDPGTGRRRADLPAHSGAMPALAFSRDGAALATADDSEIRVWDATTGRLRRRSPLGLGGVHRLAWAPDGRTFALGLKDGSIRVGDLGTGLRGFAIRAHAGPVSSLEFADDGRRLASASTTDRVARLWDADGGGLLAELRGHSKPVQSTTFSPGGRTLATASADRTVRLWDAATGRLIQTLAECGGPVTAVAFSPDGHLLAGGGSGTLRVWDLEGRSTGCAPDRANRRAGPRDLGPGGPRTRPAPAAGTSAHHARVE